MTSITARPDVGDALPRGVASQHQHVLGMGVLRAARSPSPLPFGGAGPEPTVGDDYIETPILFRGHECVFASSDNEKREPRPMCKANSRAQSLARARQVGGAIVMDRPESDLVGRNRIGVVMFGDRPHQMVCQFVDVDRLAQQRIDANLLQAFVVELVAGVGCAQDAG